MRKKTGGRDFKPGNPGGKGRPPVPPEIKEIRKITRAEVELKVMELWQKSEAEISKLVSDPQTTLRDKTIMRVMLRAIAKGDYYALGFIMDLIFGKRPDAVKLDHTSSDRSMSGTVIILPAKNQ